MFRGKILVEQKKFQDAENDFRSCVDAEPDKALGYQEFDLRWPQSSVNLKVLFTKIDLEKNAIEIKIRDYQQFIWIWNGGSYW